MLSTLETRKALDTSIKFSGSIRGASLRATQFIEQEAEGFEFPEDVVHKFVERLQAKKTNGTIESLKVNSNSEPRIAEPIL